jgi:hypothetical protein
MEAKQGGHGTRWQDDFTFAAVEPQAYRRRTRFQDVEVPGEVLHQSAQQAIVEKPRLEVKGDLKAHRGCSGVERDGEPQRRERVTLVDPIFTAEKCALYMKLRVPAVRRDGVWQHRRKSERHSAQHRPSRYAIVSILEIHLDDRTPSEGRTTQVVRVQPAGESHSVGSAGDGNAELVARRQPVPCLLRHRVAEEVPKLAPNNQARTDAGAEPKRGRTSAMVPASCAAGTDMASIKWPGERPFRRSGAEAEAVDRATHLDGREGRSADRRWRRVVDGGSPGLQVPEGREGRLGSFRHTTRGEGGNSPRAPAAQGERGGRRRATRRHGLLQRVARRDARPDRRPRRLSHEGLADARRRHRTRVGVHRVGEHRSRVRKPRSRPGAAAARHHVRRRALAARRRGQETAGDSEEALPPLGVVAIAGGCKQSRRMRPKCWA